MSNYPAWWNTTVTVYNKYEDPVTQKISWYKSIIHNCFWKYTGNRIVVGETTIETSASLCRIPKNTAFLERHIWNNTQDKSKYFTLGSGDIIIKGEIADEIDEYASGYRSSDILTIYKKCSECMVIDKCSINTGPSVGLEHYYVRGV